MPITLPAIAANLLIAACAIFLMRRGSSGRLRRLILTLGLLAVMQALMLASRIPGLELFVAILGLHAMYLLGFEIYDRNLTDRRLRLAEYDTLPHIPGRLAEIERQRDQILATGRVAVAGHWGMQSRQVNIETLRATADVLMILGALTEQPAPAPAKPLTEVVHRKH